MKNLMIYISPTGSFDNPRKDLASNDANVLVKIQIENSISLGWKLEEIMIVTNFPFEYHGIKTLVLKDVEFFERKPQATKINAIVKLFEHGIIKQSELYWFHDLDAFQLEKISENEIDISESEIGATDFAGGKYFQGRDRWSGGIFFFKSGSKDIFESIQKLMYEKSIDEEEALGILLMKDQNINERVKKVDSTYNYIGYNFPASYNKSEKPLRVVHFHPLTGKKRFGTPTSLIFFKGDNPLKIPLVTENLLKIFRYHRIK